MKVLNEQQSSNIREKFINSFIDKASEYYVNYILKLNNFTDGWCYIGYLWDCFNFFEPIEESFCLNYIETLDEIYIMWDIHSSERILIPNYWKYPKESVISLSFTEYVLFNKFFPDDIYIFDATFSWCFALTHENDDIGNRHCLFVSNANAGDS